MPLVQLWRRRLLRLDRLAARGRLRPHPLMSVLVWVACCRTLPLSMQHFFLFLLMVEAHEYNLFAERSKLVWIRVEIVDRNKKKFGNVAGSDPVSIVATPYVRDSLRYMSILYSEKMTIIETETRY